MYENKNSGPVFTYILRHTGKMKIEYNCNDPSQLDPTTKRERWKEKYLVLPKKRKATRFHHEV
ncbi:hypothetical protein EWI07_07390 [Sporolactobacillus sp. THM7-4]|nr:hypothetical protein EWI07_07390 [Sporolactobacillus sp. THM7-4]